MQSNSKAHCWLLYFLFALVLPGWQQFASAQFVAFWDHAPSTNHTQTHTNTSLGNNIYGIGYGRPVTLKNITNGANTGVTMFLTNIGLTFYAWVGADLAAQTPFAGTPLYRNFYYLTVDPKTSYPSNCSYVYFGSSSTESSIRFIDASVDYIFTGLKPQARYSFRGGAVASPGSNTFNMWTLVELAGAKSFTPSMTPNILTHQSVSALSTNQVAANFACNYTPATGDMVGWDDIDPGPDGTVSIKCTRYTGPVPGGISDGSHAYAITGFRLEEKILGKLQAGADANGTVRVSWSSAEAVLQRSTNLLDWSDYTLPNGGAIAPAGPSFFRLRK